MKILLILAAVSYVVASDNHYDTKYDNFDVDQMTCNIRLLKTYVLCFQGKGKCPPEGNDIKKWIPESSRTACAKCTEKQKALVAKVIKAIQTKLPEEWEVLSLQTDPEGKLKDDLQKFLDEYAKDQEILC